MSHLLQLINGRKISDSVNSASALICIFHGYGANRENLYDIGLTISKAYPTAMVIIPNGIQKFEEAPWSHDQYQWFSLRQFTQQYMQDALLKVSDTISNWLIKRLSELNLTQQYLHLVGFSQGAILSLYLAAADLIQPNSILAYSGLFIPPKASNVHNKTTKILAIHGDADKVLPIDMVNSSYKLLSLYGLNNAKFIIEKGIEHYITPNGLSEGVKFLHL